MNATTKCVRLAIVAMAHAGRSPANSTFITPCSIFDIQILMATRNGLDHNSGQCWLNYPDTQAMVTAKDGILRLP